MVHQAQGQFVQEPAPPSRYVLREKDRPTRGCAAPELHFPTVDVRRLAEPGDTDERGRQASGGAPVLRAFRGMHSATIYMLLTHTYTPLKCTNGDQHVSA
jgi:hypothetical protein